MKIEVAEMTGDVNNLADEIKPGVHLPECLALLLTMP
jgi:hypothetical protein